METLSALCRHPDLFLTVDDRCRNIWDIVPSWHLIRCKPSSVLGTLSSPILSIMLTFTSKGIYCLVTILGSAGVEAQLREMMPELGDLIILCVDLP